LVGEFLTSDTGCLDSQSVTPQRSLCYASAINPHRNYQPEKE